MKLRALLFDVDGTLADTERDAHRPAFNTAFREAGLPWDWDEILYGELLAVTGGKERIVHYAQQYDPERAAALDFDALVKRLHAAKTGYYLQYVDTGRVPLRPGVSELIQAAIDAGLTLAIVTTTSLENVRSLLSATLPKHWQDAFSLIAAGDIVPAKKPAPDIYLYTLQALELPAAACIAIEDSENGLRSSADAGITTVATPNDYTVGQDFGRAAATYPDLSKLGIGDLQKILRAANNDRT